MAVAKKQGRPSTRKSEKFIATTLSEVAEFFGMSLSGIYHWRTEAEPMPGGEGHYDLSEIAQWRLNRTSTGSGLKEEKDRADIRLKTVQAQQKELELEIERGNLVELPAVELWASVAMIETREMIMTLPEILATSSPPELREFVRSETDRQVRAVLTMLRRKLETEQIERERNEPSE
jgi:phage terminase Nu1 subunit (DNA packaging protein)